jgi:tetratricopeptide (TPR) repeat protein
LSGRFEEARKVLEKGLRVAEKTNNLQSLVVSELHFGWLQFSIGDGKSATEHFHKSVLLCEKLGDLLVLSLARSSLGCGYLLLGDIETARTQMREGLRVYTESGGAFASAVHNWVLCLSYYEADELGEARSYAEAALHSAQSNQEKYIEGTAKALLGSITGRMGTVQSAAAEEMILQGIDTLESLGLEMWIAWCYRCLGEFYADTGQKEKAERALRKAEQMGGEMGMKYWLDKTREVLAKLQC